MNAQLCFLPLAPSSSLLIRPLQCLLSKEKHLVSTRSLQFPSCHKQQVVGYFVNCDICLLRSFSWWKWRPLVLSTRGEFGPDAWVDTSPGHATQQRTFGGKTHRCAKPVLQLAYAGVYTDIYFFSAFREFIRSHPSSATRTPHRAAPLAAPLPPAAHPPLPWSRLAGSSQAMGSGQAEPKKGLSSCRPRFGYSK